jgi:hypothetical protein
MVVLQPARLPLAVSTLPAVAAVLTGDQRDVVRIGDDQAGAAARARSNWLRVAWLDRPRRALRDTDLAGCLHRARQRADSSGIQVADVNTGDIEQRALRQQHGGLRYMGGSGIVYGEADAQAIALLDDPGHDAMNDAVPEMRTRQAMRSNRSSASSSPWNGTPDAPAAGTRRDQAARIHRHAGYAAAGAAVDLALAERRDCALVVAIRLVRRSGWRCKGTQVGLVGWRLAPCACMTASAAARNCPPARFAG